MRSNKIYQVDAFTEKAFKGNPAGVMFIDETVTKEWMQQMAAEMNLSETAFILPLKQGFKIRYFTPVSEVPLCGHATLAAAHIVYELGIVKQNESILFKAKETDLLIKSDNNMLVMDFPRYQLIKKKLPEDFEDILGFKPIEIYASDNDWTVAIAADEADVLHANPDFGKMKKQRIDPLMITAKSNTMNADFVVRCFVPSFGINEDPVTGSAHCALTPLWAEKLGKSEMVSLQASKRTGMLHVMLKGNRVQIAGQAITVFEANLKI